MLLEFGRLLSTQEQIAECLAAVRRHSACRHFEVETYAWGVLPPELREPDLATGIAKELAWFRSLLASGGRKHPAVQDR
jgi:hypothetical protein